MAQLREWLEVRGLGRYADLLGAQDIELDILLQLTDADLKAAGLPVGARKRLLQAIEGERNLSDAAMQSMGSLPIVPTTEPATEAERRQLTVLFCDVVGSTHLAETLDAEDLRNLLLSFQKVCAEVVQRHEGQIGLFIGDGVTAYFGYPRAHEDSAQRAVQAGLDIMAGLAELGRDPCDLAGRASHPFGSSGADPANHSGGGAFGPGVRCRSSDRGEPARRCRGQTGTARSDRG
jgi:hypothetical protein